MKSNFLTTKNFWSSNRGDISLDISHAVPIVNWIENNVNLDDSNIQSCIEIGCYPGRFLTIFGQHGIELNGIDYAPGTIKIKRQLEKAGYDVNEIHESDFFEFKTSRKFDIVCSFGFIEHFKNWEKVIEKHMELVNDGGYLIVEVPNYRGFFQRIPRLIFDYKNYRLHNINAMSPKKWEKNAKANNFKTLSIDYFGGYRIGLSNKTSNKVIKKFKKIIILFFSIIIKLLFKGKQDKSYSFFIGMICQKVKN